MSAAEANKYLIDATKSSYVDHFFIEGGEPFLYPRILEAIIKNATGRGYWIGALTNGFWATSDEKAEQVLGTLAKAGLQSLGISTDAWHNEFIPVERAERAAKVAESLGIEADLMVCSGGTGGDEVLSRLRNDGFDIYPSGIICRGRASSNEACRAERSDWQTFKKCSASFGGTSRVHLGPFGQIHLCQGLLLGRDARLEPLAKIFAEFKPAYHPICAALTAGGPAALARFAQAYGFDPRPGYADGCQLCFEARRFLQPRFPDLIGPREMYAFGTQSVKSKV